ncbi:MAG: pentapeptide repeat-containing protein, partial [Actinomycetota bacterium]|nr:pentapeptide repeat-containing protein [Actinomycetota bacterium]
FTGADLTGADLSGSDLTGANLTSTVLTHSQLIDMVPSTPEMTALAAGGLTGADFSGATIGCNQFEGSPFLSLVGATFDTECAAESLDGYSAMTLSGSFLGADLSGLSFEQIHLTATDFRAATMVGVSVADYGVLPRELLFVNADLSGADLSGNTLDTAVFVGANLADASLSASIVNDSWFVGADLTNTDFSIVESEHNDYRSAIVSGTDFTNASLSWDDFSGAVFEAPLFDGLVIEAVVCDGTVDAGNGNSVRNFGLCTLGDTLIF